MDPDPLFNLFVIINPINFSIIVALIVIIILLICSALISGSEVAFFSITAKEKDDLEYDIKEAERYNEILHKEARRLRARGNMYRDKQKHMAVVIKRCPSCRSKLAQLSELEAVKSEGA